MFNCNDNDWVSLSFPQFFFNIPNSVTEIGNSVSQSIFKFIRRDNNNPDIYLAVLQIVSYMNNVSCK